MRELEETLPGTSQTLAAKQRAHAAVDKKSAQLARFLEALYELEGHDVLAGRVRQSSHESTPESAGRSESEPGESEDDGGPDVVVAVPRPAPASPAAPAPAVAPQAATQAVAQTAQRAGPVVDRSPARSHPAPIATR